MTNDCTMEFVFEGEALIDHEIDIEILVRSLRGLDNLIISSSHIVFPNNPIQSVELVGGIGAGSVRFVIKTVWEWLDSDAAKRWGVLASIIGFSMTAGQVGVSVLETLRQAPEHEVSIRVEEIDGDSVVIRFPGNSVKTNNFVIEILRNKRFRKGLDDFTSPLSHKGIDSIHSLSENKKVTIAEKRERKKFQADYYFLRSEETDGAREMSLEIISPVFRKDGFWKVKDTDSKTIMDAVIKDRVFFRKVMNKDIVIKPGDIILCQVFRNSYYDRAGKSRVKLDVLHVVEHSDHENRNRIHFRD